MKFRHATVEQGSISHQGKSYEIVDGVVDCPPELGQELAMMPLEDAAPVVLIPSLEEYVKAGYKAEGYARFVGRRIVELGIAGQPIPAEFESFRMKSVVVEGLVLHLPQDVELPTDDELKLLAERIAGHDPGAIFDGEKALLSLRAEAAKRAEAERLEAERNQKTGEPANGEAADAGGGEEKEEAEPLEPERKAGGRKNGKK